VALPQQVASLHMEAPLKLSLAEKLNISGSQSSTASTAENKSSTMSNASNESQESGPELSEGVESGGPPIPWRLVMNQRDHKASRSNQTPNHQRTAEVGMARPKLTKPTKNIQCDFAESIDCGGLFFASQAENNGGVFDFGSHSYEFARAKDLDKDDAEKSVLEGNFHTVMIKHIPCRCSQKEVLDAVSDVGFGERYNFFYLPIRRVHMRNFGYAFIGFPNPETTAKFAVAMTGYRFPCRRSPKACAVAPARVQGPCDSGQHVRRPQSVARQPRSHFNALNA